MLRPGGGERQGRRRWLPRAPVDVTILRRRWTLTHRRSPRLETRTRLTSPQMQMKARTTGQRANLRLRLRAIRRRSVAVMMMMMMVMVMVMVMVATVAWQASCRMIGRLMRVRTGMMTPHCTLSCHWMRAKMLPTHPPTHLWHSLSVRKQLGRWPAALLLRCRQAAMCTPTQTLTHSQGRSLCSNRSRSSRDQGVPLCHHRRHQPRGCHALVVEMLSRRSVDFVRPHGNHLRRHRRHRAKTPAAA